MSNLKRYSYSQNPLIIIKNIIKYIFFKVATSRSNNLFVKGSDRLSIAPQIEGLHEAPVSNYIKFSATQNNKSDFLIDIGANIGLISCQTGKYFKKIICYEPNPLCCNILKVNTSISLDKLKVEIFEFGLGTKNEYLELWVPKKNWGGAFIRSNDNSYNDTMLAKKDGFNAGPYSPEAYDAAALTLLAMQAANSTDSNAVKAKIFNVANAPGTPILPGELAKGLQILKDGGEVDYVGATAVELIGAGESAGSYREILVKNGKNTTVGYR